MYKLDEKKSILRVDIGFILCVVGYGCCDIGNGWFCYWV